jgi:predicted secreted protein
MFLLERRRFIAVILVLAVSAILTGELWAGDVASFVDLGFSENGKIYMFAQYGVDEHTLRPWSELYIVDVERNDFVPGGRVSYRHDKPVALGQDGSAALLRIVSYNTGIIQRYRTNFMRQGIPLFISLEDIRNPSGQTIDFRDFEYGVYYNASLNSMLHGGGANVRSSFYILFNSLNNKGAKKTYHAGSPGIMRAGVTTYSIRKAIVNPERTSMILVIEMTIPNGDGADIRYMVEAIRL